MPSGDRKLELKAKTSVAQTASQVAVYAKGLIHFHFHKHYPEDGRLTPETCRGLRHNKVFVKVKVY
jgi:hypothetical protein